MKHNLFKFFVLIGIIVQLSAFTIPLYDDGALMGQFTYLIQESLLGFLTYDHPPIGFIFYFISTYLFGVSDFSIRLVPLLFNFLSFFVIYKFTKLLYDQETAQICLLLYLYTFLPFFTGLIVDVDSSIIVLLSTSSLFFIYKYFKSEQETKFMIWSLIFAGLLFSLKLRIILLLIPLSLFIYFISNKQLKLTIKYLFYLIISIIIFNIINLIIIKYIAGDFFLEHLKNIFLHNFNNPSESILAKFYHPMGFINLFFVLTPLYLFLPIMQIIKWRKHDSLMIVWLVPTMLLFLITLPSQLVASFPRYFSILYPPIIILAAVFLNKNYKQLFFSKRLYKIFNSTIITIILITITFIIINILVKDYWFFVTADSPVIKMFQPLFMLVYFITSLSIILYVWFLKRKKHDLSKMFLSIFLIISLSFNLFIITETFIDSTHRNLINDIKQFSQSNNISMPIYSWNEDVPYYVNINNKPIINIFNQPYINKLIQNKNISGLTFIDLDYDFSIVKNYLENNGGTIILMNYPLKYLSNENRRKMEYFYQFCNELRRKDYKTGNIIFLQCQKDKKYEQPVEN